MVSGTQTPAALLFKREGALVLALGLLGALLLALAVAAPWIERAFGYGVLVPLIAASGLVTIAATMFAPAVPVRAGLLVILGVGVALRLVLVADPPLFSTDIYRYVWDGRVQGAGINPYRYVPADAALAALRDADIYPNINRADYAPTAYPPVAQMFFFLVTRLSQSLTAMRLALIGCEVVVVALLLDLLRTLRLPATAVVAWVWHPLPLWEIANNGHIDALMVALAVLGLWLLVRARRYAGVVAVAAAVAVKPYAAVLLPLFQRRWDWRVPLLAAAVLLACYLPYLGAGRRVFGFLASGYLAEEGLTDGGGFWLTGLVQAVVGDVPGLVPLYVAAAGAVLAWLALRVAPEPVPSPRRIVAGAALLMMAGLFFLSPNYAWYFLAVVPFLVLCGPGPFAVPAWAMTLGAFLLYRPVFLPDNDLVWKTLASLPFVIAVLAVLVRGRRIFNREATPWPN
jgi:hypothetical protein